MTSAALPTARPATATSRKALNSTLWLLQVVLAGFFVMVGYSHALMPFDQVAQQATWMHDVPRWLSRFIGYAEMAGGLGLIIPAATRIAPWLTPRAALGLATIMILAMAFHVLKGEASIIWIHATITAVAVVVAWGRWRTVPFAGRSLSRQAAPNDPRHAARARQTATSPANMSGATKK